MNHLIRKLILIISIILSVIINSNAQLRKLNLNESVRTTLKAGQIDKYTISLKAGQFASVKIKQETVGVAYMVYAPNDSLILNEDLNAIHQNEIANIAANKTGDYRIEVVWDYYRPQFGEYSILWDRLENIGQTDLARAEQLMNSFYRPDEPGAAVIVLKENRIIFKSVKGLANLEYNQQLTGSSVFQLASVSKQFTGFAIAMLIGQRKLSLEDDIRKYLPEVPDFGKTITIRNLLYHTSGLTNWDSWIVSEGFKKDDIVTMDMIVKMVADQKQLDFDPGSKFAYCNTGYDLLTKIVEKVSGQSYSSWIQQNVFNPLGMKNTKIDDGLGVLIPARAYGYMANSNGFDFIPVNYFAPGSASVYSSPDDLAKWVNNFDTHEVGGENTFRIIQNDGTLNNGDKISGGFGNFTGSFKGTKKIEHLGLTAAYRTAIARYPEQKLAVIYLSNDGNDATYNRASQIAEVFLKGLTTEALKPVTFPDLNEFLAKTMPVGPQKTSVYLKEYEGVYYSDELNVTYKLQDVDSALVLVLPRLGNVFLTYDKPDVYHAQFYEHADRQFYFLRDDNKHLTGLVLDGDRKIVFEKVKSSN